jgi:hypothetical protein
MTEPTDANAELMKAAVKRSRDQYKLDTSRAAFQAGAIFGSAFRTPQATQPQAGAVPLTDEQWQRIADLTDSILTRATKDEIERVIGIKGGQHGAE